LILRHWNVIADTLHSGEVYLPLLLELHDPVHHPFGQGAGMADRADLERR
jgi:hypothetical protein